MIEIKSHYYLTTDRSCIIRIRAKKRPSIKTIPKSGTWVVNELINDEWRMPCFPEITWNFLNKLIYLYSTKKQNDTQN